MRSKLYLIAAAASFLALGGCSYDDIEPQDAGGSTASTEAEVITTPVEIRLGMPSVNFMTRAAFEDDADEFDLGVFCLAREKQDINYSGQNISWWDTSVDPLFSSTFCLLNNIESTKSGQAITWKDGEHRYYPFTQFYSYDFYAYYPYVAYDDEVNSIDTTTVGRVTVNYTNLDGKTDILWGRATSEEQYAYSAKYFRIPANKDKIPTVQLDHMLTRLKFQVVPGESYTGSGNYAPASEMIVSALKIKNVVKNVSLLVADLERDKVNEHGTETIDGTDEPDRLVADYSELQTLYLCGADGEPFDPVQVSGNPLEARQLGESFLLYPEHKYLIEIVLTDGSGTEYTPDSPLELIYPRNDPSDNVFKSGCQYVITLEVHGPKEVEVKAQLTPWQDPGLTPEEQDDVDVEL